MFKRRLPSPLDVRRIGSAWPCGGVAAHPASCVKMPSGDTPSGAPSLQSEHHHSTGMRRGTTFFLNALQPPPLRGAMGTPGMAPLPYTLVTFSTEPPGRWYIWSISFTLKACKSRTD